MFGCYEIIFFSVDEESRNVSFFYMFSNWIQIFDIKIMLSIQANTLSFIVDFTKLKAIPLNIDSPPPCF